MTQTRMGQVALKNKGIPSVFKTVVVGKKEDDAFRYLSSKITPILSHTCLYDIRHRTRTCIELKDRLKESPMSNDPRLATAVSALYNLFSHRLQRGYFDPVLTVLKTLASSIPWIIPYALIAHSFSESSHMHSKQFTRGYEWSHGLSDGPQVAFLHFCTHAQLEGLCPKLLAAMYCAANLDAANPSPIPFGMKCLGSAILYSSTAEWELYKKSSVQ
ncbi:hypothetical protein C8F04DRAFT_1193136 [Mycena alexandri]|uniref:Uncharacterized protein n=1 Tax=Mycena alexandri TaxID=1745969 RepID=A0AAD6WQY7_9AGAR|nr:hypothetical protein C8F04DRAFT_1193136 [Mycena alexandri]